MQTRTESIKEPFVTQLTVDQCRAARALVDWSQARLCAKVQVSEGTVRDFEKSKRVPAGNMLAAMRSALELAGVAFLSDGETMADQRRSGNYSEQRNVSRCSDGTIVPLPLIVVGLFRLSNHLRDLRQR